MGQDGGEHFISEAGTGIAHAGESAIFAAFTGSSLPALAGSARVARKAGRH